MATRTAPELSSRHVAYIINHTVLPHKLPQGNDYDAASENALILATSKALHAFKGCVKDRQAHVIDLAAATIDNLRKVRTANGLISDGQLTELLRSLVRDVDEGAIPLEINAQNAGILIRRVFDEVIFELFELSPTNESVYSTKGRLVRYFPASASEVRVQTLLDESNEGLIETLAQTISKLAAQSVPGFQAQAYKADKSHVEIRDTTHPGLVTDYLRAVTSAIGQPATVSAICKNTREEVLWCNSLQPWRRSSLWMLIRVSLQILFKRATEDDAQTPDLYKCFMAFFLSQLLDISKAFPEKIGADTLHSMSTKLLRRIRKLELLFPSQLSQVWMKKLKSSVLSTHERMSQEWKSIQDQVQPDIDMTFLTQIKPEDDIKVSLFSLDRFLQSVADRKSSPKMSEFQPSSTYIPIAADDFPEIGDLYKENNYLELAEIEKWVEKHLSAWLAIHIKDPKTCGLLGRLIRTYHSFAMEKYSRVPTSLSIMYLTIIELWAACDKSACAIHPLLLEYNPEIGTGSLQSLSLPLNSQLKRLSEFEKYIKLRQISANENFPSLFHEFGTESSFACRFFDGSSDHQNLMEEINDDAAKKRKKKIEEMRLRRTKYNHLVEKSKQLECEFQEVVLDEHKDLTQTQHDPKCAKCKMQKDADAMDIMLFEEPLSADLNSAKATVFELRPPESFVEWRDTTWFLALDVLGFKIQIGTPIKWYMLHKHADLAQYLTRVYDSQNIMILSEVKPVSVTHYRMKRLSSVFTEEDVCVKSGLRYRYYDYNRDSWTGSREETDSVSHDCTYQLPARSEDLQRFLNRPPSKPQGPTPNEVIAGINYCPENMSIEEYKAFGSLLAGWNIRYANILTQLAMPVIDFSKPETQCLILQTIHEAGSKCNATERECHQILTDRSFCIAMIGYLDGWIAKTTENWESWRAIATFIQLTLRILSICSDEEVQKLCLRSLDNARETTFRWLNVLISRARSANDDDQQAELLSRAVEVSLACTTTLDVDGAHVNDVLVKHSSLSALIQCSIVIQENSSSVSSEYPPISHLMLKSWKSLLHRLYLTIKEVILRDNTGINDAITAAWKSFHHTSLWKSLDSPYSQWLQVDSGDSSVHFNILSAELLVNGLPLAHLPQKYTKHQLYIRLFNTSRLEVAHSDEPGMSFSANHPFGKYKLDLGMNDNDLFVVASDGHTKWDLIPPWRLKGTFPVSFEENYVHWYNRVKKEVIFCPLGSPWDFAETQGKWLLRPTESHWSLTNGSVAVLGVNSRTHDHFVKVLKSLENRSNFHLLLDTFSGALDINLPRLQIGFQLEHKGDCIFSQQHRGMIIDPSQRIGTLIGLDRKLVLKSVNGIDEDRLFLIPEGQVHYSNYEVHMNVSIDRQNVIRLHTYHLDETLQRVMDSGSIQSKLFLSYLHALTSYCLPDPFTGYTGIESALSILKSAAVRSFEFLAEENIEILEKIARLAPRREYYPRRSRRMQQITWNAKLSLQAQSSELFFAVRALMAQAEEVGFLSNSELKYNSKVWDVGNISLFERDMMRSAVFRRSGFGAEQYSSDMDTDYEARDKIPISEEAEQAYIAAKMVVRDQRFIHNAVDDNLMTILRKGLFRSATIRRTGIEVDPSRLRFDAEWLEPDPGFFLSQRWCDLHESLSHSKYSKFDIMMWLSAIAYGAKVDFDVVQILCAFYKIQDLALIEVPSSSILRLKGDDSVNELKIRGILHDYTMPFSESSNANPPRGDDEPWGVYRERIQRAFNKSQQAVISDLASALAKQWPCEQPTEPNVEDTHTYVKLHSAMEDVSQYFKSFTDDHRFWKYIEQIVKTLAQQNVVEVVTPPFHASQPRIGNVIGDNNRVFSSKDIFSRQPDPDCFPKDTMSVLPQSEEVSMTDSFIGNRVSLLCNDLDVHASSQKEKEYVKQLRRSCKFLQSLGSSDNVQISVADNYDTTQRHLHLHLIEWQLYFEKVNTNFNAMLKNSGSLADQLAASTSLSLCTSPTFWLRQLNRPSFDTLSEDWKKMIVNYGLTVTILRRAQRLLSVSHSPMDLSEELRNPGHRNWDPSDFPESLLLEAESGLTIREVQEEIAKQMREPPANRNTVMQLNMGEGKSSVIVPMVAAALADGTK